MSIDNIISELTKLDKSINFTVYRKAFDKFLEKNKLKEIGRGVACVAYSKRNFKYVIKIAMLDKNKFRISKDQNTANPIFYSKNKIVVIQDRAITPIDIENKIKYQKRKLSKLKSELKNIYNNMYTKFRGYSDIHDGNVGIINNELKIIDLNNHF